MSSSTATLPPVASTSQLQQQGHDQSTSTTPPPSSSTFHLLPPSLREILDAFAQNGGGDRELLLAILGAKRAEEDRLASSLSLQTQLFLLQSQHQQPFHMIPQIQLPLPPPRRNQLDDAPPSPSSLSSSSSSSSGPSTPPPSHSSPEMDSSIGPIRSAKLSLVRAKLLARKEAKQQQQPQRWSNASSASPPPRSPRRSATPKSVDSEVPRRSPEATRVALSGLMGVTGSLGVVASSVRPKESWVRAGGSADEEDQDQDQEMEEVVRVKLESQQ